MDGWIDGPAKVSREIGQLPFQGVTRSSEFGGFSTIERGLRLSSLHICVAMYCVGLY